MSQKQIILHRGEKFASDLAKSNGARVVNELTPDVMDACQEFRAAFPDEAESPWRVDTDDPDVTQRLVDAANALWGAIDAPLLDKGRDWK